MSPIQLGHEGTAGGGDATEEPAASAASMPSLTSVNTVCERCRKLFGQQPSSYQCACQRASHHYHLGPIKSFMVGTTQSSPCPGCRLIGTIVTNAQSMIRRNNVVRLGLDETGVTADLQELREMVFNTTTPGITLRPAARVVNVLLDALPGLAGTIIKTANTNDDGTPGDTPTPPDVAQKVHGLFVQPILNIERIKQWLATCRDRHNNCRGHGHSHSHSHSHSSVVAGSAPPPLPPPPPPAIRLIDVDARQIVSATLVEDDVDFAALSYVWGKDTRPLLTSATLPLYESPGGLDAKTVTLPRTIADAMHLVRDLGFRYLWVDSLCIVQDDDADKLRQLPLMAALYEAAALVVVAAVGIDAEAGLGRYEYKAGAGAVAVAARTRTSQSRETINGVTYITTLGGLVDVLRWTRWDRRGWTYQEAFRSRRALVFTDALVYWSCRDTTWREDLDSDAAGVRLKLSEGSSLWRYAPGGGGPHTIGCTPNAYYTNVEHFSCRAFRDGGDAIWAFVAILAHQAPRFPANGFIWAHPYGSLSASLLWRHDHSCLSDHGRGATLKECHSIQIVDDGDGGGGATSGTTTRLRVPFPSWSWLSSNTGVQFLDTCDASVVGAVEWHPPIKLGGHAQATSIYLEHLRRIGAEGATAARQKFDQAGGRLEPAKVSHDFNIDYGLLLFTAETVQLTVSRGYTHTGDDKCPCRLRPDPGKEEATMTYATVRSAGGSIVVGDVVVPPAFFKDKETGTETETTTGEFVLLSSNAWPRSASDERCHVLPTSGCAEVKHVQGCAHIASHNLMLVAWDKGVAYRRACWPWTRPSGTGLRPR